MKNIAASVVTAACLLALAACGGGGGGSARIALDTPATVGVLITDAPVGRWDEAIATVTSVRLIGDNGQVTLFSGSQTLDLLKLGDFSELFAVSDNVPPGRYSKIRLQLSDLVLNDIDPVTGNVLESIQPQLVGNGKIDLNPQGSFVVGPGDIIIVELDFDMAKSLKITETGNNRIILRPVVFVNIRTDRPDGRLARVHGEISRIDPVSGKFELCQTDFASRWDGDGSNALPGSGERRCLTASTDISTGIFAENGLPETFADLAPGEQATVIGRLQPRQDDGHPPSATDHSFVLDAYVIEEGALGTYSRIRGITASGTDGSNRFALDIASGQGFGSGTQLPVQIYDSSRIFNRAGLELSPADIVADRNAVVDSILIVGQDDYIRSPLIILNEGAPVGEATIEGDIISTNTAGQTLRINDGTMDRCVNAEAAGIFLVSDDDGFSSTRGQLSDLRPGQRVAIFGTEQTDGCLAAETILAEI
ncbi:MAG: DUF4382 domain-containing protein [Gammaproteobacteria bacterium]|nr:DUF4382 domain-containing protein [Gammaproteobacteria bacterium]